MDTVVLKFGGAAVATPERFSRIADIVLARRKEFPRVVVVVSAMGDTTNQLLALANKVNPTPPQRELDMLVSVGERVSASLLAMALDTKGMVAVSFTGSQAGIITTNDHTDARIVAVKPYRLEPHLAAGRIAIVAGFQGVSCSGEPEITTLGRGGSDTTAVALAKALGAEHVEFYKDVAGVYERDPKEDPTGHPFPNLTYAEAAKIVGEGASVLSSRCIALAEEHKISLHLYSFHEFPEGPGTCIGKGVREDVSQSAMPLGGQKYE